MTSDLCSEAAGHTTITPTGQMTLSRQPLARKCFIRMRANAEGDLSVGRNKNLSEIGILRPFRLKVYARFHAPNASSVTMHRGCRYLLPAIFPFRA